MNSTPKQAFLCIGVFFFLACHGQVWAKEKIVGVLISREITPYVAMVEGLEAEINQPVQRFFLDQEGRPYSLGGRNATLNPQMYDALVAVGPEALQYFNSYVGKSLLIYGMVLNPENVIDVPQEQLCGVSLNIPAVSQFFSISQYLPNLKRLGVLFDPKNNQVWFKDSIAVAEARGFELVPLQVNRQGGRMEMVGDFTRLDAILFIPDKSIISKAVIQYVIKQGVVKNIPVIGYNQFFYDSGAALSFLIDYHKVGKQVAHQAQRLLAGEKCEEAVFSDYKVFVNDDVWRSLHLGERSDPLRGGEENSAPGKN